MPEDSFKTVPDELLHVAAALEQHVIDTGYEARVEGNNLGFPYTPTLVATNGHETLVIELASALDLSRMNRWIKFCRSQNSDTRLCAVVSHDVAYRVETAEYCRVNRLGLWTFQTGSVIELRSPVDLAIQVDLPDTKDIAPNLRRRFANPFRKISNGEWRDGLNDIYLIIEDEARSYLINGINRGRIVATSRNRVITAEQVAKMTMGQLAVAFTNIHIQNQQDALIGNTLAVINPTRVMLTHKRMQSSAEQRIRGDVGKHVWAAISCLEEILK